MEYTIFSNSPVENLGYYYTNQVFDTFRMDADCSVKLRDIQADEFLNWDLRNSIDEDKNPLPLNDMNQSCAVDRETVKFESKNSNQQNDCDFYKDRDYQDCLNGVKVNYYHKAANNKYNQMEKDKEDFDQYDKVIVSPKSMKGKKTDAQNKEDGDIYFEKPTAVKNMNYDHAYEAGASTALPKKRKLDLQWQSNKMRAINSHREMINSGRMTGWLTDEIDIEFPGELTNNTYTMNEALLALPGFKQEAPSPTNGNRDPNSPPHGISWMPRQQMMNNNMVINENTANCNIDQHLTNMNQVVNNSNANQQGIAHTQMMQTNVMGIPYMNGIHDNINTAPANPNQNILDPNNSLLLCPTNISMEGYGNCAAKSNIQIIDTFPQDNLRFQYVLAAATSIATKCNEDTLTYLNQSQSYEIKLKKLGDLSFFRGKIVKSIIRICFYERRLQYAEREQMAQWQIERPGERIVEVDVPLSYGLLQVYQPTEQPLLNTVEIYWDPIKEVGVYIKVNCISTEFTAKKHGGEKGVPFRIQVETFLPADSMAIPTPIKLANPTMPDKRLHAGACQIKVFKLKGADRKHKQDKEKILRRPSTEREKYQPSCDCTVFVDLPSDAIFSPTQITGQPYSPEQCHNTGAVQRAIVGPSTPPVPETHNTQMPGIQSTQGGVKFEQRLPRAESNGSSSVDCEEDGLANVVLQCNPGSPGFDVNIPVDALTETSTPVETRNWLMSHRFLSSPQAFANFSGADVLRLTREDLIQICGMGDGIRLFNILHPERTAPRLTIYLKRSGEPQYNAIYLRTCNMTELRKKIQHILQDGSMGAFGDSSGIFVAGPNNIMIRMTDEVVQNFRNDSMFRLEPIEGGLIMKPA